LISQQQKTIAQLERTLAERKPPRVHANPS